MAGTPWLPALPLLMISWPSCRHGSSKLRPVNWSGQDLLPTLQIDAHVGLGELDWAMLDLLMQLEPCGYANPQPVLASYGLEVAAKRLVGQSGEHLKLTVRDPGAPGFKRSLVWDAIAFRQGAWFDQMPPRIDLAYTLECNEFNGDRRLQLNVKDIRPAA